MFYLTKVPLPQHHVLKICKTT